MTVRGAERLSPRRPLSEQFVVQLGQELGVEVGVLDEAGDFFVGPPVGAGRGVIGAVSDVGAVGGEGPGGDPFVDGEAVGFEITEESFVEEISSARTFALESDVAALKEQGLIRGGSLENAILVGESGVVNEGDLRFPDEFARHKVLDLLGDLALLGRPLRGSVHARKSGHATNVRFVESIFEASRKGKVSFGTKTDWDIGKIEEVMPHRYPFLLVDRILELDRDRVVGMKNFTTNEWFFVGHFPRHPIVPAVLIIEAMAQVGGFLLMSLIEDCDQKLVYFMGIDNARFRKPVRPGDTVRFELELLRLRGRTCKMRGAAYVGGELVADGDLWSQVVDR